MAQRACAKNINSLQDVGDMEYALVRPILKRITNPVQLRAIETASPHIADHDSELWKGFIARDIPAWEDKIMEPKNPRSWCKVYRMLVREEEKAKKAQEENLRATLTGLDQKRESSQANITTKVLPYAAGADRQVPTNSRARPVFADGNPNPHVTSSGQPRKPLLKNAKGADILSAIRRQSSQAQREKGVGMSSQPARVMLPSAKSQIAQAPAHMVRDHAPPPPVMRPQQSGVRRKSPPAPKIFVSKKGPSAESREDRAVRKVLEDPAEQAKKEERLRALANGRVAAPVSPPSSAPRPVAAARKPFIRSPPRQAPSPPDTQSPAQHSSSTAGFRAAADTRKPLSPSPAPPSRKRPAQPTSIFMPAKKRKKTSNGHELAQPLTALRPSQQPYNTTN
ncbi:hypothetical protein LTR37_005417 [Vermiconidia calcicola]|uniref:Uncharacterized protein n=1 Tax=Vermiconidia calcicola TaxID=1690605 RepID=A0ACC3NJ30_9PEZI|nr:hypothetical protein LTR37_005417 [Vermiconidia calcicola]